MTLKDKQEQKELEYLDKLVNYKAALDERKIFLSEYTSPIYQQQQQQQQQLSQQGSAGSDVEDTVGDAGSFNPTTSNSDLVCPCEAGTYRFTSAYGSRWGKIHGGVDLAPKTPGDPNCRFYAAGDGVVVDARKGGVGGFSTWIIIKHNEKMYSLYGHFPPNTLQVKTGDVVKKGQYLANMGQEGDSYGIHLHFELSTDFPNRKATRVDPENYIDFRSGATAVQTRMACTHAKVTVPDVGTDEPMHGDYEDIDDEPLDNESERILKLASASVPYVSVLKKNGLIEHTKTREQFLEDRILWARKDNYASLVRLDKDDFVHTDADGFEGNLYSPDAKEIFEKLLKKTKLPYFEVVSGFRFSEKGRISPHEAGCAIDIKVDSIKKARELADCAWQIGIRAIAFGGSFSQGNAYVHMDIAPIKKRWSYGNLPIYNGPNTWIYREDELRDELE